MVEYVDKQELLRSLERKIKEDNARRMAVVDRDFIDLVNDATVIEDVVEVRHGKWVSASNKSGVNIGMKCSLCGARIKYSEHSNGNHRYCHKCGAKMGGERKEQG